MSLSVYKLDGAPGEGPICVLSRGEYQIGRGPLLKCFDQRASRHQALIKVEAETSSITSTHKTPCFYQSAKGKTIIILPEYSPVDIQTGDKFGLFPDKCWFKFHFEPEEGGTVMSKIETSQDEGRLKRPCELTPEVTERKQPKLADEESDTSATKSKIEELVESSSVCNPEGDSEVIKKPENCHNGAAKSLREDGTSKVKDRLGSDGNDEPNATINNAQSTVGSHVHVGDNEVQNVPIVQGSLESNVLNGVDGGETKDGGIVNDNSCHGEDRHECLSNNSDTDVASVAASSSANAVDSQPVQKKEKLLDSEHEEREENDENHKEEEDGERKEEKDDGEEEEDDEHEEQNVGPQPDGNASASTKREKCWYGSGCYRKNAKHRLQFSHPGDADYVPDPNDDRPTCSYGANCYRRNKDHRKEYKHPGKPAANQKRKRKRATKTTAATRNDESSEDDYDYDDPFLDDGSEDEYEEESWSDDDEEGDSDEDWENSQNASDDEDTVRNLLKEAKRFTRKKK